MTTLFRVFRSSARFQLHHQPCSHSLHQYRHVLQFANTPTNERPGNEPAVRLSTQYPPPPLQERYSRSTPTSNAKIEPYRDVQFKPKEPKTTYSGDVPPDVQENNIVDQQSPAPSSPGMKITNILFLENSVNCTPEREERLSHFAFLNIFQTVANPHDATT